MPMNSFIPLWVPENLCIPFIVTVQSSWKRPTKVSISPELSKIVRIVPSEKMLIGLVCNVEYKAISAESGTAHGYSPSLAILDEVGKVRGPHNAFIEAIETAYQIINSIELEGSHYRKDIGKRAFYK